jgi:predicted small secreted protein
MRRAVLIAALLATLAGCATVEGFGRDLSAGARRTANLFD